MVTNDISEYTQAYFDVQYKDVFINLTKNRWPESSPTAYVLGGQPGAGKTKLQELVVPDSRNFISINGDEFRNLHPHYAEIQKKYGKDSAAYTQSFSNSMCNALRTELGNLKYNMIIEGTLRKVDTPTATCKELKSKGYKVELSVIAVKPELSFVSTLLRYEKMLAENGSARFTQKASHDEVVRVISENLNQLYESHIFDNITIYNRYDDCLYNQNNNRSANPKDVLNGVLRGDWTFPEKQQFNHDLAVVEKLMRNRGATELQSFLTMKTNMLHNIGIDDVFDRNESIVR